MSEKKIIIIVILLVFGGIFGLWISGIIPRKNSKTSMTDLLENSHKIKYSTEITNIDDVYNQSITNNYKDIRTLPQTYSLGDAQKDNCFVIGAMVHNDNLYTEFMNKYNKKENAYIRVV